MPKPTLCLTSRITGYIRPQHRQSAIFICINTVYCFCRSRRSGCSCFKYCFSTIRIHKTEVILRVRFQIRNAKVVPASVHILAFFFLRAIYRRIITGIRFTYNCLHIKGDTVFRNSSVIYHNFLVSLFCLEYNIPIIYFKNIVRLVLQDKR